jgi:hypothetical protein
VTTGKVVSLLGMSSLLCFLLLYFFALSFYITFGKDLYADLVAPRLRVSLLGISSFLCFCFFISLLPNLRDYRPGGVAPGYIVFVLLSIFQFFALLSPQHSARMSTPILWPLDFGCRSWICRFFCFYHFCLIFISTGKVMLLLGKSSLFCFLLFYFLHYLSPQHSARISTTILWLLDFGCSLWVCRLFFVSDLSLFPYLHDHLQGGVAPGYVVFALLSLLFYFLHYLSPESSAQTPTPTFLWLLLFWSRSWVRCLCVAFFFFIASANLFLSTIVQFFGNDSGISSLLNYIIFLFGKNVSHRSFYPVVFVHL